MKNYQKVMWLVVGVILVIIAVTTTYKTIEKNKISRIEKEYDMRLTNARLGQETALRYLNVFKIHDSQSYLEVKTLLYNYLSGEMQKEIFPTEEYALNVIDSVKYEVLDVKSAVIDDKFVYKVIVKLVGDKEIDLHLLIGVRNNKIVDIERL